MKHMYNYILQIVNNILYNSNYIKIKYLLDKELLKQWKFIGKNQKIYDNKTKNYIHSLTNGALSKMQIPNNEKNNLGLTYGFLIFQIDLNETKSFTIEVSILDSTNVKRRLLFSACSKELVINSLYCRIPLINFPTNIWVNLSIDIFGFVNEYFKNINFKCINFICLSANCKVRKICAMKKNFVDSLNEFIDTGDENLMPNDFLLPTQIDFINLTIDMNQINDNINLKLIKVNNGNNTNYLNSNNNTINNNIVPIPKTSQGHRTNQRLSTLHNTNNFKNVPNSTTKRKTISTVNTVTNNNSSNLTNNTTNSNTNSAKSNSKSKSKSLGKQYLKKISSFNPTLNKTKENNQNINLNLTRKKSTNTLNSTKTIQTINSNFSPTNSKIKQWNLYDQNGRRINRNVSHINEIRENNFDLSKTQKPIKSKTPDRSFANTLNHRTSNINNNKNKELKNQTLKLQKTIVKPPLLNNKAIPEVFKFNKIPIKNFNIENQIENKSKLLGIINYNDDNTNANNNNNASIQEVVDYDQNNTLLKGENNTTRESEKIIYRDKNDNLKILNIRIKDDSIKDSQNKNSNKKDFIEESLKENLLQNINESTTNRPYTPPVSNMIPDDGSDNVNNNNIKKINESIIKNHYNEMVYDKETGKYFNSRTNIYYDLK